MFKEHLPIAMLAFAFKCQFTTLFYSLVVLLIGGIVGVAGQFRNWQFAAFAMYPLRIMSSAKGCYVATKVTN